MSYINVLSNTLFSKTFNACSIDELEEVYSKFPSSAALQFLYTKKLNATGSADFNQQLQKALLYYKNPLLINNLLNNNDQYSAEERELEQIQENNHLATEHSGERPINEDKISVQPNDIVEYKKENALHEKAQLPTLKIEAIDPATAELSFTPYHTIDYFAAQGIKFSENISSNDKFGAQLKSFTAWLKQMKRLPGATVKSGISVAEEKTIEQLAEKSLNGQNADTEAMAEVWAKQGDRQKAIALYQKLSLQNPSKSAYFAAKIEHLKK